MAGAVVRSCSVVVLAVSLALPAPAQTGFTTEKHDELGLSFQVPLSYEPLPVPPDEAWVVLSYAEKLRARTAKAVRPAMDVIWIDALPAPASTSSGSTPPATTPPPPTPSALSAADASGRTPIHTVERYLASRFPGWTIGKGVQGKSQGAFAAREALLMPGDAETRPMIGWFYAYSDERRTIALVGSCGDHELKEQVALWRTCAERLRLYEPVATAEPALAALYAKSTLRDTPFRIDVRKRLVRGWRAEDTSNYIVVFSTKDQPLIRKMCLDIEFLRTQYEKYFPPVAPILAVSTVRVCRDRDEYLAYGGDAESLGYWHAAAGELVLYDAPKARKLGLSDDSETFEVLYHEAFHQFIHYSAGELAPHPWFNEGHGDFFGGAIVHGEVRSIEVNARRCEVIQAALAKDKTVPWSEIVRMEERAFMENASLAYAQSWSMVYFLRIAPEVQANPAWAAILPMYFETLKRAFVEEKASLPAEKAADRVALWQAGRAARAKALDVAFAGIDLDEIENAWKRFVAALAMPAKK
jgi:hypothetical protein